MDAEPFPESLTMITLDAETPDNLLEFLVELSLSCGVLPPNGSLLRGVLQPAVCLIAVDQSQNVVSCAAASAFAHATHPQFGPQAWWGMLATHASRRGQRLALILGAKAILQMNTQFGFQDFMTGVEPGNAPSEAVCARLGLEPSDFAIVACADQKMLTSGRMTK